jgi:beta-glucuronidase
MYTLRQNSLDLNGTWKFNPDPYQRCRQQSWWKGEGGKDAFFPCFNMDGLWDIQVPGTWKKQHESLEWYDGDVNYVLDFELDDIPEGHEAFLCFDQVIYHCDVYLNGHNVGRHTWGYSPFQLKVSGMLSKKNRLFVLVENKLQEDRVPGIRCDWNNDGGITGGVKLIFVPKVHLQNFRTSVTLRDDSVELQTELFVHGRDSNAQAEVEMSMPELGISEKIMVKVGQKTTITHNLKRSEVELWCPENPKLYDIQFSCGGEIVKDEIGLREIRTEGTKLLLNGSDLKLAGVAVHSEFPETGRAPTQEGIEKMLAKAKDLGVNFLRCAHYPYPEIFGRAMDKAGMLWWEEVPVYWLPDVHTEPQCSAALGMMRETIVRDWNRASLIIWSVSNECAGDGSAGQRALSLEEGNYPYWVKACAQVREMDPSRLISSADSGYRHTRNSKWTPGAGDAFDEDTDSEIFLPAHPDEFYALLDILGSNVYVSKLGANPSTTQKWVDMLRPYNKPLMLTEFGSMSTTEENPEGREPTEVGHPEFHKTILKEGFQATHEHPEIVGVVPWALMDVRVPMHWRWYNRGSGTFAYGFLDNDYQEKAIYPTAKAEISALKKHWGVE